MDTVELGVKLNLYDAEQQISELRQEFNQLKVSIEDAPNATDAFNQGIQRALDITTLLAEKISEARLGNNTEDSTFVSDIRAGLDELKTMKDLFTTDNSFSATLAKNMFNGFSDAVRQQLNRETNVISSIIKEKMSSLKSTSVAGMAKEIISSSNFEEFFFQRNHGAITSSDVYEKYIRALLPNVLPTFKTGEYSLARYGQATRQRSQIDSPEGIIPDSFRGSYNHKKYLTSNYADKYKLYDMFLTPNIRNQIRDMIKENDAAARAARNTKGMIQMNDDDTMSLSYNITPQMLNKFRQNLFEDYVRRASGMASRRIDALSDPFDLTSSEERKLVSRMTSGSAAKVLKAMSEIDDIGAKEHWGTSYEKGYENIGIGPRRSLERYEVSKINFDDLFGKKGKGSYIAIDESQNTRMLGLHGHHNEFTDKIVLISNEGYDEENAEHQKYVENLLSRKPVDLFGDGKKYIAQNMHGMGEHSVIRMIEEQAYEKVRKREAEWAKRNGFVTSDGKGTNFWNDFIDESYNFENIQDLRKHYDATGKGWSPGYAVGRGFRNKKFAVVNLSEINDEGVKQKLADGLGWFVDGVLPMEDAQGRIGVAGKGTFHTLKGFKTLGEWAGSVGLLNEQGRFVLKGPRGDIDLTDYHGMSDISTVKNAQAYDNFKTAEEYNAGYTKMLQRYGASIMTNYEDAETRARGIGAQAMAFVKLSPKMQDQQINEALRRIHLLDTEAGRREYLLSDPDNYLGQQLRKGKITIDNKMIDIWAQGEKESLTERLSKGEWIDFGIQPSVVNQALNKSPLSSIIGTRSMKGENESDILSEVRKAYEKKTGKQLQMDNDTLAGVLALREGQAVDFTHPDEEKVSMQRSPSLFGNFVSARNYAKEALPLYKAFGLSTNGVYASETDMKTLGGADFDGDKVKVMYGEIAAAFEEASIIQKELTEAAGFIADPKTKPIDLPGVTDFKDSPLHARLNFETNNRQALAMGSASSAAMRASSFDLRSPLNRDMLIAAIQSNPVYEKVTAGAKNATETEITPEMRRALYHGAQWSKLPTKYSGFFNVSGDKEKSVPKPEDIFEANVNGEKIKVNLAALRDANLDAINFRSIYSSMDVGSMRAVLKLAQEGVSNVRPEALLQALDKGIGYGDAGEKTKALMQNLRRMKVYDIMNPIRPLNEQNLLDLEQMTDEAEREIESKAHDLSHGQGIVDENGKIVSFDSYVQKQKNKYGITAARNYLQMGIHERNLRGMRGEKPQDLYPEFFADTMAPFEFTNKPEHVELKKEALQQTVEQNDREIERLQKQVEEKQRAVSQARQQTTTSAAADATQSSANQSSSILTEDIKNDLAQIEKLKNANEEIRKTQRSLVAGQTYDQLMSEVNNTTGQLFSNIISKENKLKETPQAETYYRRSKGTMYGIEKSLEEFVKDKDLFDRLTPAQQERIEELLGTGTKSLSNLVERDFNDTTELKAKRLSEKYAKMNRKKAGSVSALEVRFDEYDQELKDAEGYRNQLIKNAKNSYNLTHSKEYNEKLDNANKYISQARASINERKASDIQTMLDGISKHVIDDPFSNLKQGAEEAKQEVTQLVEMLEKVYKAQGLDSAAIDKKLSKYKNLNQQIDENTAFEKENLSIKQRAETNRVLGTYTADIDGYDIDKQKAFLDFRKEQSRIRKKSQRFAITDDERNILNTSYSDFKRKYDERNLDVSDYLMGEEEVENRIAKTLRNVKKISDRIMRSNLSEEDKNNRINALSMFGDDYARQQRAAYKEQREYEEANRYTNIAKQMGLFTDNKGMIETAQKMSALASFKALQRKIELRPTNELTDLDRQFLGYTEQDFNKAYDKRMQEEREKQLGMGGYTSRADEWLKERLSVIRGQSSPTEEEKEKYNKLRQDYINKGYDPLIASTEATNDIYAMAEQRVKEREEKYTERYNEMKKYENNSVNRLYEQLSGTPVSGDAYQRNVRDSILNTINEKYAPESPEYAMLANLLRGEGYTGEKDINVIDAFANEMASKAVTSRDEMQRHTLRQSEIALQRQAVQNEREIRNAERLAQNPFGIRKTGWVGFYDQRLRTYENIRSQRDDEIVNLNAAREAQEHALHDVNAILPEGKTIEQLKSEQAEYKKIMEDTTKTEQERNEAKTNYEKNAPIMEKINGYDKAAQSADKSEKRIASFNEALGKFGKDGEFSKTGQGIAATFDTIGQSVNRFISRFGYRFFMSIINETKKFIKQFDSQMKQIQAITLKTDDEMEEVRNNTIETATKLRASVENVASVEADLYRQGLDDNQVQERMEAIVKFATVTGSKVTDAGKAITTAIQNGLVSSAQEAMDVLVALGDSAATTANEIYKGMQKSASAAKVAGVSYAELTTLLTIGTSKTQLSGQVIGTGLQTIFSRMNRVTNEKRVADESGKITTINDVENALKAVGVNLREEGDRESFRGSFDVLRDLSKVWGRLSDVQRNNITYTMAGGRQANMFQTLMEGMGEDNGAEVERLLGLTEDSEGLTDEKYSVMIRSVASSLTELKSSWDGLVESLSNNSALTGFIDMISNILQGMRNFVQNTPSLVSSVFLIVNAIGALVAAVAVANAVKNGTKMGGLGTLAGIAVGTVAALHVGSIFASIGNAQKEANNKIKNENEYSSDIGARTEAQYENVKKVKDTITRVEELGDKQERGLELSVSESKEFESGISSLTTELESLGAAFDENGQRIEGWRNIVDQSKKVISELEESVIELHDLNEIKKIGDDFKELFERKPIEVKEENLNAEYIRTKYSDQDQNTRRESLYDLLKHEYDQWINAGYDENTLLENAKKRINNDSKIWSEYGINADNYTDISSLMSDAEKAEAGRVLLEASKLNYNIEKGTTQYSRYLEDRYGKALEQVKAFESSTAGLAFMNETVSKGAGFTWEKNKYNEESENREFAIPYYEAFLRYATANSGTNFSKAQSSWAKEVRSKIADVLKSNLRLGKSVGFDDDALTALAKAAADNIDVENLSTAEELRAKVNDWYKENGFVYEGIGAEKLKQIYNADDYKYKVTYKDAAGNEYQFGSDTADTEEKAAEEALEMYKAIENTPLNKFNSEIDSATGAAKEFASALNALSDQIRGEDNDVTAEDVISKLTGQKGEQTKEPEVVEETDIVEKEVSSGQSVGGTAGNAGASSIIIEVGKPIRNANGDNFALAGANGIPPLLTETGYGYGSFVESAAEKKTIAEKLKEFARQAFNASSDITERMNWQRILANPEQYAEMGYREIAKKMINWEDDDDLENKRKEVEEALQALGLKSGDKPPTRNVATTPSNPPTSGKVLTPDEMIENINVNRELFKSFNKKLGIKGYPDNYDTLMRLDPASLARYLFKDNWETELKAAKETVANKPEEPKHPVVQALDDVADTIGKVLTTEGKATKETNGYDGEKVAKDNEEAGKAISGFVADATSEKAGKAIGDFITNTAVDVITGVTDFVGGIHSFVKESEEKAKKDAEDKVLEEQVLLSKKLDNSRYTQRSIDRDQEDTLSNVSSNINEEKNKRKEEEEEERKRLERFKQSERERLMDKQGINEKVTKETAEEIVRRKKEQERKKISEAFFENGLEPSKIEGMNIFYKNNQEQLVNLADSLGLFNNEIWTNKDLELINKDNSNFTMGGYLLMRAMLTAAAKGEEFDLSDTTKIKKLLDSGKISGVKTGYSQIPINLGATALSMQLSNRDSYRAALAVIGSATDYNAIKGQLNSVSISGIEDMLKNDKELAAIMQDLEEGGGNYTLDSLKNRLATGAMEGKSYAEIMTGLNQNNNTYSQRQAALDAYNAGNASVAQKQALASYVGMTDAQFAANETQATALAASMLAAERASNASNAAYAIQGLFNFDEATLENFSKDKLDNAERFRQNAEKLTPEMQKIISGYRNSGYTLGLTSEGRITATYNPPAYVEENPLSPTFRNNYTKRTVRQKAIDFLNGTVEEREAIEKDKDLSEAIKASSSEMQEYISLSEELKNSKYGEDLKKKIILSYEIEGMAELVEAGKLTQEAADAAEKMKKGGVFAFEGMKQYRAEQQSIAKTAAAAGGVGMTEAERDEYIMSFLGIESKEKYYGSRAKYRQEYADYLNSSAYRSRLGKSIGTEYLAAVEAGDKDKQNEIESTARIYGFKYDPNLGTFVVGEGWYNNTDYKADNPFATYRSGQYKSSSDIRGMAQNIVANRMNASKALESYGAFKDEITQAYPELAQWMDAVANGDTQKAMQLETEIKVKFSTEGLEYLTEAKQVMSDIEEIVSGMSKGGVAGVKARASANNDILDFANFAYAIGEAQKARNEGRAFNTIEESAMRTLLPLIGYQNASNEFISNHSNDIYGKLFDSDFIEKYKKGYEEAVAILYNQGVLSESDIISMGGTLIPETKSSTITKQDGSKKIVGPRDTGNKTVSFGDNWIANVGAMHQIDELMKQYGPVYTPSQVKAEIAKFLAQDSGSRRWTNAAMLNQLQNYGINTSDIAKLVNPSMYSTFDLLATEKTLTNAMKIYDIQSMENNGSLLAGATEWYRGLRGTDDLKKEEVKNNLFTKRQELLQMQAAYNILTSNGFDINSKDADQYLQALLPLSRYSTVEELRRNFTTSKVGLNTLLTRNVDLFNNTIANLPSIGDVPQLDKNYLETYKNFDTNTSYAYSKYYSDQALATLAKEMMEAQYTSIQDYVSKNAGKESMVQALQKEQGYSDFMEYWNMRSGDAAQYKLYNEYVTGGRKSLPNGLSEGYVNRMDELINKIDVKTATAGLQTLEDTGRLVSGTVGWISSIMGLNKSAAANTIGDVSKNINSYKKNADLVNTLSGMTWEEVSKREELLREYANIYGNGTTYEEMKKWNAETAAASFASAQSKNELDAEQWVGTLNEFYKNEKTRDAARTFAGLFGINEILNNEGEGIGLDFSNSEWFKNISDILYDSFLDVSDVFSKDYLDAMVNDIINDSSMTLDSARKKYKQMAIEQSSNVKRILQLRKKGVSEDDEEMKQLKQAAEDEFKVGVLDTHKVSMTAGEMADAAAKIMNAGDAWKSVWEGFTVDERQQLSGMSGLLDYMKTYKQGTEEATQATKELSSAILTSLISDLEKAGKVISGLGQQVNTILHGGAKEAAQSRGSVYNEMASFAESEKAFMKLDAGQQLTNDEWQSLFSMYGISNSNLQNQYITGSRNFIAEQGGYRKGLQAQMKDTGRTAAEEYIKKYGSNVRIEETPIKPSGAKMPKGKSVMYNVQSVSARSIEDINEEIAWTGYKLDNEGNLVYDESLLALGSRNGDERMKAAEALRNASGQRQAGRREAVGAYIKRIKSVAQEQNRDIGFDILMNTVANGGAYEDNQYLKQIMESEEFKNYRDKGLINEALNLLYAEAYGIEKPTEYTVGDRSVAPYIQAALGYAKGDKEQASKLTQLDKDNELYKFLANNYQGFESIYNAAYYGTNVSSADALEFEGNVKYTNLYERERAHQVRPGTSELARTLSTGTDEQKRESLQQWNTEAREAADQAAYVTALSNKTDTIQEYEWDYLKERMGMTDDELSYYKENKDKLGTLANELQSKQGDITQAIEESIKAAFNIGSLNELADSENAALRDAVYKILDIHGFEIAPDEEGNNKIRQQENKKSAYDILFNTASTASTYAQDAETQRRRNVIADLAMQSTGIEDFESKINDMAEKETWLKNKDEVKTIFGDGFEDIFERIRTDGVLWDKAQNAFIQGTGYAPLYRDRQFELGLSEAQQYIPGFGTSTADLDNADIDGLKEYLSNARGSDLVKWFQDLEGGSDFLNDLFENTPKAAESLKALNAEISSKSITNMNKYGRDSETVANNIKDLGTNARTSASAVGRLVTQMSNIHDQYLAGEKAKGKSGKQLDSQTRGILSSAMNLDESIVKNMTADEIDNLASLVQDSAMEEFESTVAPIFVQGFGRILSEALQSGAIEIDANGKIVKFDVDADGMLDTSELGALADALNEQGYAELASRVGMIAEYALKYNAAGDKISVESVLNALKNGGGYSKGGGGGGGGGKSEVQKMLERLKREKEVLDHRIKMIQYQETKYENAGELGNLNNMIETENRAQYLMIDELNKALDEISEKMKTTKKDSDDMKSLQDTYRSYEEAIEAANNAIEENNRKIEKNQQEIYKRHTDLEDQIRETFEKRKQNEKNMLDGTVNMQSTIIEAIRQRYRDEWALIQKDIEKKRAALEEEKSMIDERLQRRRDAEDEATKYEELEEYQRQLAMIELDSTRTKDAAELREKIEELQKERAWKMAEDEANYQKEIIDEQIGAYDDYVTNGEEDLESYLEDTNNFADEVNGVMSRSQDGLMQWLKENIKEYGLAMDDAQKQMVWGWTDMYEQMLGITHTYLEEIAEILSSPEKYIDFMMGLNNPFEFEFRDASEDMRKQMLYQFNEAYRLWQVSLPRTAEYWHDDDWLDGIGKEVSKKNNNNNNNKTEDAKDKTLGEAELTNFVGELEDYDSYMMRQRMEKLGLAPESKSIVEVFRDAREQYEKSVEAAEAAEVAKKIEEIEEEALDIIDEWSDIPQGSAYNTYHLASGGLVDYTGPAWVDGTKTKPEAFLSAADTAMMRSFLDEAQYVRYRAHVSNIDSSAFSGTTQEIGELVININEAQLKDDADFDAVAQMVGERFTKELAKQGFHTASYAI